MNRKSESRKIQRTPAEAARLRAVRERFQRERPGLESLVASGEYSEPVLQADFVTMLELAAGLKKARQEQGLSLADVADRSGIDRAAISRIENGLNVNPTVATLENLARSLGTRLRFSLEQCTPAS